ncbi:MAG: trypsin-like peptidase domain-containing protein [Marinicella sp.]
MEKKHLIILTFTILMLVYEHSVAKVYKWVDEDGKIHFTDKPPQDVDVKIEELKIKTNSSSSKFKIPHVQAANPIRNDLGVKAKSVLLEYASVKLSDTTAEKDTLVGKAYKFTAKGEKIARNLYQGNKTNHPLACIDDGDLDLGNAEYIIRLVDFITPFQEVFTDNNYKVISKSDNRFNMQQKVSSDLSLGATIKDIKLAHCGRSSSANLNVYSQNSTYLKVHWEVFDNLSRKVVYETETEGGDNYLKSAPRKNGAAVSFGLAFRQSVEGLISEQGFVDVLTNKNNKVFTEQKYASGEDLESIDVTYGDMNTEFLGQVDKIKQATATIRTTSGHGSGFVITNTGYVLTNHHVANQNSQLMVIIQGKEHIASLVKSDPQRDVALLKIENDYYGRAVKISNKNASLGEKIYVIGTPLDELLDFSISSGIISANRKIDGDHFYQTDAAVNPGNSGGPVFDNYGNVIGITVAGHFTESGGSQNINYLIPIDAALDSLGINKQ